MCRLRTLFLKKYSMKILNKIFLENFEKVFSANFEKIFSESFEKVFSENLTSTMCAVQAKEHNTKNLPWMQVCRSRPK